MSQNVCRDERLVTHSSITVLTDMQAMLRHVPAATVSGLLSAVGCAAPALNLYTFAASAAFSLMSARSVAIFRSSSSTPACRCICILRAQSVWM